MVAARRCGGPGPAGGWGGGGGGGAPARSPEGPPASGRRVCARPEGPRGCRPPSQCAPRRRVVRGAPAISRRAPACAFAGPGGGGRDEISRSESAPEGRADPSWHRRRARAAAPPRPCCLRARVRPPDRWRAGLAFVTRTGMKLQVAASGSVQVQGSKYWPRTREGPGP